jgi:hypothetical protein
MAHQSRWGWHPCDYATFLLLKELNCLHERALRQFAAWRRWQRKMPHNRVIRRRIVDAHGRKVSSEIIGPMPEPPLTLLFCVRRSVRTFWSADGKPLKEGRIVEEMQFEGHGIADAYRAARRPMPSADEVKPLSLTEEDVRRLMATAQG